MPNLNFAVESAHAVPFAAAPTIAFQLRLANAIPGESIHSIALRCQIQIEAQKRHYAPGERALLGDLFGEPERWSRTLRPLLWTHVNVTVPEFVGSTTVSLPVACTFDFNVAAAKYFYALEGGEVLLNFQFSGTVFYPAEDGALQIAQIGWDKEAKFRLPVQVWRDMMDVYYPDGAWLRLQRDVFDRLYEYKRSLGLATWEEAIERLLPKERQAAT
ncbi:MAG TPA: DUF6084 family protein [Bryobacteraceae bacterium]|nr:DUF6084 family protein [Bryobacteraceae bacterium]